MTTVNDVIQGENKAQNFLMCSCWTCPTLLHAPEHST